MLGTRVIPCLLLRGSGLVKTRRFKDPTYLGDPINIVKIFNEKGVDELILLDITATPEGRPPNFPLLSAIAGECFVPMAYGGGIRALDTVRELLALGFEKVVVNTQAVEDPGFVSRAAELFGRQAVVVSIDVRKRLLGGYEAVTHCGTRGTRLDPVALAKRMEGYGAGEILVNSIDRDGAMAGYDVELIRRVSGAVGVPVIACGGAGGLDDLARAVHEGGASAAAAGSMFVFQGPHRAVLITFPAGEELERVFPDRRMVRRAR